MPISDSAATELAQLLGSGTADKLIPELVRQGLQALIEAEAATALVPIVTSAPLSRAATTNACWPHQRATISCASHASGLEASFFPSLLEPRRRVDRALWAVVMEAYVSGVSTRKVDELVVALGCESGTPNRR